MKRTALLGTSLLATLALAACTDRPTQPRATSARLDASADALTFPRAMPDRALFAAPDLGYVDERQDADLAARAINPSDYVCSNDSPVNTWINGEIARSLQVERTLFLTAYNYLADLIPTYEALYFQTTATPQYFGYTGQHTKIVGKTERDLKNFWAINSSGIQFLAMHGNVLLDTLRTARTYQLFGYSAAASAGYARTLRNAILPSQTMVNGNHPFFTFNAVAFTTYGQTVPDKIVVGDGILAVYDALGFADVAPQAILAHEFAHHVQFQNGFRLTGVTAAERTRFNELGADMMAAYFLTHARGAAMNQKRVEQFLEVFYEIGDCAFTSSGHHGTPNQRMAAARTGFALADSAQVQGHIMTPDEVQAAFVAAYSTIIAPDAH